MAFGDDVLTEAGWGWGGTDRVVHWYERQSEGRWRSLCGKVLLFVSGPRRANIPWSAKCRTCSKRLKKREE